MIELLGTGGTIPIPNQTINNLANGDAEPDRRMDSRGGGGRSPMRS